MADALGADGEGFPDGFRAGGFAGVIGKPEPGARGLRVKCVELLGAAAALIAESKP